MKFKCSNKSYVTYRVKFKDKTIEIPKGGSYNAVSKEEIDFLSKQQFIAPVVLGDKEYLELAKRLKPLPTIDIDISDDEASAYLFYDPLEPEFRKILRDNGLIGKGKEVEQLRKKYSIKKMESYLKKYKNEFFEYYKDDIESIVDDKVKEQLSNNKEAKKQDKTKNNNK